MRLASGKRATAATGWAVPLRSSRADHANTGRRITTTGSIINIRNALKPVVKLGREHRDEVALCQ